MCYYFIKKQLKTHKKKAQPQKQEKPVEELEVATVVDEQELVEETIKAERTNEELADLIQAKDVLALLDRARTSLARKAGNAINVPVREVRALINGLIADVSALKGEK